MSVNRYSNYYQPQYQSEPLDQLLSVGMKKAQNIDENLQLLQQSEDYLANIPALPGGDTNKRNEILKSTESRVKEIVSSGKSLSDPMVGYQINGLIHAVSNNKDLQNIVGAYYGYTSELQKDIQDAKKNKSYSASHALPSQQYWYERMTDENYHPGPEWQPYTNIERPTDYRKEIQTVFDKVKDSGDIQRYPKGSPNAGQPVLNSNGEYIWLNSGKGVDANSLYKWGLNKGYLTQEALRSIQLDSNYAYRGLTDEEQQKKSPQDFQNDYFKGVVGSIAPFYGHYVGDVSGFGAIPEHLLKPSMTDVEVPSPEQKTRFQDMFGLNFDGVNMTRPIDQAYRPVWSETGLQYVGNTYKSDVVTYDKLDAKQKALYKDAADAALALPENAAIKNKSLGSPEVTRAISNYMDNYEKTGLLANNPVKAFNMFDPHAAKVAGDLSNQFFEKDNKGNWTGRGLILNSIVYDDQHPQGISGTQFVSGNKEKIEPLIMGQFTADNPTDAVGGYWFQDNEGKQHYAEYSTKLKNDPIAIYSNKMYQAQYNPTKTNYFDIQDQHYKSTYDNGIYQLQQLDEDYNPKRTWRTDGSNVRTPEDLLQQFVPQQ